MTTNKHDKVIAICDILRDDRAERTSVAAVKRTVEAAKVLGLTNAETIRLLSWMDHCDRDGNPYKFTPHFEALLAPLRAVS